MTPKLSLWAAIAAYRSYPDTNTYIDPRMLQERIKAVFDKEFERLSTREAESAWFSASHYIPVYRPQGMMDD